MHNHHHHHNNNNNRGTKKRPWSLYEIAFQIDQQRDNTTMDDNSKNNIHLLPRQADTTTSQNCSTMDNHKIQETMETLETKFREMQGTLQQAVSEINQFKTVKHDVLTQTKDMVSNIEKKTEKSQKTLSESINHLSIQIQTHNDRLASLENPSQTNPKTSNNKRTEDPKRGLRSTRNGNNNAVPKTSSKFNETTTSEDEDDDNSDDGDKFEKTLNNWNDDDDDDATSGESKEKAHCQQHLSDEEDTIHDEKDNNNDNDDHGTDGIHNTLHQVIICLHSQAYTDHTDLDNIVRELEEVAKMEYPTAAKIQDVCTRQALILKLITCFYQTVCVVSKEYEISSEQIYGNEELLQQVLDKVQAMI